MLSDEAFFLVVFLVACALLALGSLEMVWPTRPRHPVRRSALARDPWRRARPRGAPVPERVEIRAAAPPVEPTPVSSGPAPVALVPAISVSSPPELAPPADVAPPPEPDASPPDERSVVERGFALVAADRFAEALALAEDELRARRAASALTPSAAAAQEMTRLWGVVGLARQGLDDFEGARFAFEEAIALAPQSERETWERHLAGLASIAARRSLDEAAAGPARAERIETIRSAIDWLERALAVAPEDAALRDTLLAARAALWRANEDVVKALIRRKAFDEVRRRLEEVSADPECPPGRQRAFRTLRVRALAGEAVAATTDAMRHLGHGRPEDSMAALARAESVLTEVSGALTAKRRQELTRKLWLGYMKVGIDRLEAGEGEAALGPLCRALRLDASGDARLTETRATLVRTLERVVETRSVEIGALIEAGDAALAAVQGEKLWSLLRGAVDQGLPQDRLTDTFATVEGLFHRIGTRSSS